jgi:ArsR family transcriptional regulator
VSTHLARLREAGLVADRREGVSVYYRINGEQANKNLLQLWTQLHGTLDDALIQSDTDQLRAVLDQRARGSNWPDSVAGDMERHYSPGRTWESTARALVKLIDPGRVLDIASGDGVMGELLAGQADHIDCVDVSPKVVEAGVQRVAAFDNVRFHQGDMHQLPFPGQEYDTVLLLHALTYSPGPELVLGEAARVLKTSGRLIVATLNSHRYAGEVEAFGHINSGFAPSDLEQMTAETGLKVDFCGITSIERKKPNFKVITLLARKS